MGIFGRLGKIFQAEAHSAVDKLEDPIKMAEQGLRDLRNNLKKSIEALAEVKAMAIRSKNEAANYKAQAEQYQAKAVELLKRAQQGAIDQAEAERLAAAALQKKNQMLQSYQTAWNNYQQYQAQVDKLEATIRNLKQNIQKWENEVRMLRARASVAKATKKVNKELANIDYSSTVSMLERMKEKVAKEEALAQSYAELASENKSVDEEIDQVLADTNLDTAQELEALKAQIAGTALPENEQNQALPESDINSELDQLKKQIGSQDESTE